MNKQEHPIDKLFASRLQGLEPTPAADAWSRLETGLQQKKASKKGVIWWYCAAAVAVLILFGALLMGTDTQLDGIHATDIASSLPDSQSSQPDGTSSAETRREENNQKDPVAEVPQKESKRVARAEKPASQKTLSSPGEKVAQVAQPARSAKQPAVKRDSAPVKQEEQVKLPGQEPSEAMITQVEAPDTVTAPVSVPTDSEQTLVVVVQLPEEKGENVAPAKGQRMAGKLWENLKKVKHGEFRELGLAPDELMARFRDKDKTDK